MHSPLWEWVFYGMQLSNEKGRLYMRVCQEFVRYLVFSDTQATKVTK